MVKIRLARFGKRHQPRYRLVVCNEQEKRRGKFLEILGHFDPQVSPAKIKFEKDRLAYWLGVGAQMTEAVKKLVE